MRIKLILIIGVLIVALAAWASPALATNEYESPGGTHTFGGEQSNVQVFTLGTLKIECKVAEFGGQLLVPATTVNETVKKYDECTVAGTKATTTVTSCSYEFGVPLGTGPVFKAVLLIKGSGGTCSMKFATAACTITIGGQSSEFIEAQNTSKITMHVDFQLKGLIYGHTGTCSGIGTGKDGVYTGGENIENLVII
jgi:hypothetical protein